MQNPITPEPNARPDDVEELLESIDDSTSGEPDEEVQTAQVACNIGIQAYPAGLYDNPNIAGMFLDTDLTILFATPKTRLIFKDYYEIVPKPFFNIFQRALAPDEIRELHIALKSFERGFSWSGTLRHKTPSTRTLYTKTNILPLFSESHEVNGFLAVFDDVTEAHRAQLQGTFKGILEAAKLKDNDTGMHDERVGYYSKKFAEYLYAIRKYPQIDPDFIDNIFFLAPMHDVGKIGTPDYILQKPGKLSDQEWEIMREHTINGTFILASYPVPMAKEIALSHHEWWNGMGYPFKLEGEMIPLAARIVTIADVYDALRMKRTYKNELSHTEAVDKIIAGKGTQFDPELIEVFERLHPDFEDIWNLLRDTEFKAATPRDRSKEYTP